MRLVVDKEIIMKKLILLLPTALLVVSMSALQADTILVPSQQPTIQAGIDAAVDSDTVLVADGTYTGDSNRNINFHGKAIVVMSENGPYQTTINCQGLGRGFHFHRGEVQSSVVQGFLIKNGIAPGIWGGGVFCDHSSPSIINCIFWNNYAVFGGGIACEQWASPIIERCVFVENTGRDYGGGIIMNNGCNPTITGCYFLRNNAITGAAMRCGGLTSPTISSCFIIGNIASQNGGGIELRLNSSPSISDCVILDNHSGNQGGGVKIGGTCDPIVTRCLISDNTAGGEGGGVMVRNHAGPVFENCTISNNVTYSGQGGGIAIEGVAHPTVENSILWDNEPGEIDVVSNDITVTYSDVKDGWPGEGNINEAPTFVLPGKRDYRLIWESPCIDTGNPDSLDADGTRRDMGAYYFNQNDYLTLYMTPDATEVTQGGNIGVTYTIINRWQQKEPFSALTRVTLPDGEVRTVLGPEEYHVCGGYTAKFHLTYDIPSCAYVGMYEYQGAIGVPPSTLYDDDSFKFTVIE